MKTVPEFVKAAGTADVYATLTEQDLETSKSFDMKLLGVSRRDFMRIAQRYGLTSTLAGVAAMTGIFSAESLAQTVNTVYEKRFGKPQKHLLKAGAVISKQVDMIQQLGLWPFVTNLEEVTDGEVRVEIIGSNQICSEQVCIQKALQGVIDIATSSTQNASSVAPWYNAIDFPYMFQTAGQVYHFFFSPKSEKLFRSTLRSRHKIEMLFTSAEMRDIFMGSRWKDKKEINSVADIAGTKNRVTNTQLGRIGMQLMNLNPVPIAWVETLDALKSGLIDGAETWATAAASFNMAPAITHVVRLRFIPGTGHTMIRSESLEKVGPLKDVVLEQAYQTQRYMVQANAASLERKVGFVWGLPERSAPAGTIFGNAGVKLNQLSNKALDEAEEMCKPTKAEYNTWHEKLNKWAGFNVYESILPVAREYSRDAADIDVEARRWWKSA